MRVFDQDLLAKGSNVAAWQRRCLHAVAVWSRLGVLCCVIGLMVGSPVAADSSPLELGLEGDSSAGHLRLTWSGGGPGAEYELQQSEDEGFSSVEVRYRGEQTASVLSGLPNGEFYFRVRTVEGEGGGTPGPWSSAVSFVVTHYSLQFAVTLLVIGALIFLSTVVFLVVFSGRVETDD